MWPSSALCDALPPRPHFCSVGWRPGAALGLWVGSFAALNASSSGSGSGLALVLAMAVALVLVVMQKAAVGAVSVGVLGCISECCPCSPRFLTVLSPGVRRFEPLAGTCQLCFLLFGNLEAVKA